MAHSNAYPFTLIYHDTETNENWAFHFYHHKKELDGEDFVNLLTLPAEELWRDYMCCDDDCDADVEEVLDLAETYRPIAIVPGHVDVEFSPYTMEIDYEKHKPALAAVS